MNYSFRKGNLAEDLGVVLLRGLAAVAPVPRTEDQGIDAVVTLLRPAGPYRVLPEDSFFVQIKAASERLVASEGEAVRWLKGLKLPYFIGSVDVRDSSISLYCGYQLSHALREFDFSVINGWLDPDPERPTHVNEGFKSTRNVYLGPPVLKWGVAQITDSSFLTGAYAVMKPWLKIEQQNIDLRGLRYTVVVKEWETGIPPIQNDYAISGGRDDNTPAIMQTMLPAVQTLGVAHHGGYMGDAEAACFEQLVEWMRARGVDPYPDFDFRARRELSKGLLAQAFSSLTASKPRGDGGEEGR
jgi:hypothetical protein